MKSIESDSRMKISVSQCHESSLKVKAGDLQRRLPEPHQHARAQSHEKGGSSTLTTIPVAENVAFPLM